MNRELTEKELIVAKCYDLLSALRELYIYGYISGEEGDKIQTKIFLDLHKAIRDVFDEH